MKTPSVQSDAVSTKPGELQLHLKDFIWGLGGNDAIFAYGGDDEINPGQGNDTVYGGEGSDWIHFSSAPGGIGVDLGQGRSWGADGNDTLWSIENVWGSEYSDHIVGSAGTNRLYGAGGSDTMGGGLGNDILEGGAGNDMLWAGTIGDYDGNSDFSTNLLYGWSGNDYVYGGDGHDVLYGDSGNDFIAGNGGWDLIDGGAGNDTATYLYAPSAVSVLLSSGTASGGDGQDVLRSIENLVGSAYDDWLVGDNGANRLDGGAGRDTLVGGNGVDSLTGGAGVDAFIFLPDDTGDVYEGEADTIHDYVAGEKVHIPTGETAEVWSKDGDYVVSWYDDGWHDIIVDGDDPTGSIIADQSYLI